MQKKSFYFLFVIFVFSCLLKYRDILNNQKQIPIEFDFFLETILEDRMLEKNFFAQYINSMMSATCVLLSQIFLVVPFTLNKWTYSRCWCFGLSGATGSELNFLCWENKVIIKPQTNQMNITYEPRIVQRSVPWLECTGWGSWTCRTACLCGGSRTPRWPAGMLSALPRVFPRSELSWLRSRMG